jgi:hypothetical protein
LVGSVSDGAFDPILWGCEIAPGFEGAPPAEVVGEVFGGHAIEPIQPSLEAAVVSVDVIEVEVRRLGGRLARRRHRVQGNFGLAREGGDRSAAIADQMIFGRDDARQRRADRGAVDLGQHSVEGRALPVASDKNGNVFLIEAGMPRRSSALARLAAQIGPAAFEGFEEKVSSASTMPVSALGLSVAGEPRNR